MDSVSLYLVATPIGNLSDVSARAIEILTTVDFVAAEDTRKSGLLLKHFNIKKNIISYYEHNAAIRGPEIIKRLLKGQKCALVSDAGMPAISDPGELLVKQCYENGLKVSAIPGPCAAVTALAMSGLSTRRFSFEGFLSTTLSIKKEQLNLIKNDTRTIIIYEAPHRLLTTLRQIYNIFGQRRISIVREITKIYEQVMLTSISEAIEYYEKNDPRGEFVLIIEGAVLKPIEADEETVKEAFWNAVNSGMTKSAAAKSTAVMFGLNKREIYNKFKDE